MKLKVVNSIVDLQAKAYVPGVDTDTLPDDYYDSGRGSLSDSPLKKAARMLEMVYGKDRIKRGMSEDQFMIDGKVQLKARIRLKRSLRYVPESQCRFVFVTPNHAFIDASRHRSQVVGELVQFLESRRTVIQKQEQVRHGNDLADKTREHAEIALSGGAV